MISCTDFIPAYSELFKFLEAKGGMANVHQYWAHIASDGLMKLDHATKENGLRGVFDYFSSNLNEEAADFHSEYDEEEGIYQTTMRFCPSKGRLLSLKHMTPFHSYCEHCSALYAPVLEPYGIDYHMDLSRADEAYCVETISRKK